MAGADRVFGTSDLLSAITFELRDIRDLTHASGVSAAFLAAARARASQLRVLRWESTIRGRDHSLASEGFYFHRHVVQLPDRSLCVPDVNNRGLRLLSETGALLQLLRFPIKQPRGLASDGTWLYGVAAGGEKFFSAPAGPKFSPAGEVQDFWHAYLPGPREEQMVTPDTCAVDASTATLYLSDSGRDRVHVVDTATLKRRGVLGGEPGDGDGVFNRPQGLAARRGVLAVCDAGNSRVQLFDGPGPAFVRALGRHGAAPGCFNEPRGVGLVTSHCGDGDGPLLLVVAESRRLQVLTLRGEPLQVLVPGVPPPGLRLAGPPGLWGVAIGVGDDGDARAFVVNNVSNELHVLSVHTMGLRLPE